MHVHGSKLFGKDIELTNSNSNTNNNNNTNNINNIMTSQTNKLKGLITITNHLALGRIQKVQNAYTSNFLRLAKAERTGGLCASEGILPRDSFSEGKKLSAQHPL